MLVGRRHREGEVEIQEGEGMIAVEEAAEVGSRAQAERLALNSIGALSFLQGRKAEVVVVVVGGNPTPDRALRALVKEMFRKVQQMEISNPGHGCRSQEEAKNTSG